MGTLTDQDERALEMPAFLRRYQIDGETLARLIKSLGQVVSHLKYGDDARLSKSEIETLDDLCETLELIERRKIPHRLNITTPPDEVPPVIDPATIALKAALKERVALQIVQAIDDEPKTFGRIRKAVPTLHIQGQDIPMPDRVLRSALNYLISGKLTGVRIIKAARSTYAIERR
tara:strand:- start:19956 stop:20480 length:525 start_codon:yes stop_codon:yes gene_type:complete